MAPRTSFAYSALLFDAMPPSTLRESVLVVVSTRPINLNEEAERSARLTANSSRGLFGRVTLLDASRGDLADLIQFDDPAHPHVARAKPTAPPSSALADVPAGPTPTGEMGGDR